MLKDPVRVAVTPAATTVDRVDQRVILVDRAGEARRCSRSSCAASRSTACWSSPAPSTAPTRSCARSPSAQHRRRGDPRQQVAEPARARARRLPRRQGAHAGGDRHRRARHRRRGHQPRRQLRPAQHPGELRPPHRPHRARRRRRRRDLVLRRRGARLSARHREADPHLDPGDRPARRPPCGQPQARRATPLPRREWTRTNRARRTATASSSNRHRQDKPQQGKPAQPHKQHAAQPQRATASRASRSATAKAISPQRNGQQHQQPKRNGHQQPATPLAGTERQRRQHRIGRLHAADAAAEITMPAASGAAGRRANGIGGNRTCRRKTCSNSMAP